MTVRWTVRAAEDRARSSRENRVPEGAPRYSSIAQSVERMTVNHDVTGSSPVRGAKSPSRKTWTFSFAPVLMLREPCDTSLTGIVRFAN